MNGKDLLSSIISHTKYARYLPREERRETWEELVARTEGMMLRKFPSEQERIEKAYNLVREKKVLPSMRSLQFGGAAIEKNESRIFNCAYLPVNHPKAFAETMFLLLGGSGVGYSVQQHHVRQLSEIRPLASGDFKYLVFDSLEGWAEAVRVLCKAYFTGGRRPRFDFRDIRPKGSLLFTAGGKAPGPEPLKRCLEALDRILNDAVGRQLRPIEAHDMQCHIASAVLSGGIRRAAMISLFSYSDMDMRFCKAGEWWKDNPQRSCANNSVVLDRRRLRKNEFDYLWQDIKDSNAGEPGVMFSSNPEWGINPCAEASLRAYQFCNLTTINAASIVSEEDLFERTQAAATIGTLQATFTDLHYLRPIWKSQTEKDSLLGVSMTGLAYEDFSDLPISEAAYFAVQTNEEVANLLGINPAARVTNIKPEGTTSTLLGTSSGCHGWFDDYYIRRVRVFKNEAIYSYLREKAPFLLEDDVTNPASACVCLPIEAAEGGIKAGSEDALQTLERVKWLHENWVAPGHVHGDNKHNVSVTVYPKDSKEWDEVGEWMWNNKYSFSGISVLPYDGGTYEQPPHESITKEEYDRRNKELQGFNLDLSEINENEDNTDRAQELACAGDQCLI